MIYEGSIFKGLDKILSKDLLRPELCVAYIDDGNIIATDSIHMVKIRLSFFGIIDRDSEVLEQKCIDIDTIKKLGALKANQKWFINEQGINVYKANSNKVGLIYPLDSILDVGVYPDYNSVIPSMVVEQSSFCINPQLMLNIERIHSNQNKNKDCTLLTTLHGCGNALKMTSRCKDFIGIIFTSNTDAGVFFK